MNGKMEKYLLDSYVFLDVILGTSKAEKAGEYLALIENGKAEGAISSFCILEVKYHTMRKLGHDKAEEACYFLQSMPNLEIIAVSNKIAELAADIRFKYYDKKEKPLSFGDAVHIATALESNCTRVISGESDFRNLNEIKSEIY